MWVCENVHDGALIACCEWWVCNVYYFVALCVIAFYCVSLLRLFYYSCSIFFPFLLFCFDVVQSWHRHQRSAQCSFPSHNFRLICVCCCCSFMCIRRLKMCDHKWILRAVRTLHFKWISSCLMCDNAICVWRRPFLFHSIRFGLFSHATTAQVDKEQLKQLTISQSVFNFFLSSHSALFLQSLQSLPSLAGSFYSLAFIPFVRTFCCYWMYVKLLRSNVMLYREYVCRSPLGQWRVITSVCVRVRKLKMTRGIFSLSILP